VLVMVMVLHWGLLLISTGIDVSRKSHNSDTERNLVLTILAEADWDSTVVAHMLGADSCFAAGNTVTQTC
jgi:hypothetical protein